MGYYAMFVNATMELQVTIGKACSGSSAATIMLIELYIPIPMKWCSRSS